MKIVRQARPLRFTVLDTELIEDTRLSYRARGLLAYLLSRPDHWVTDHRRLARLAREGERAVLTALKELEVCGYLTRTRMRDTVTGRWATTWEVRDQPAKPHVAASSGYRDSETRDSGNRDPLASTDSYHGNLKDGTDKQDGLPGHFASVEGGS